MPPVFVAFLITKCIIYYFFLSTFPQQIQDAADQGVMFVGFVQEPYGAPCTRITQPDTPSLSLHSSPSSVLGSLGSCSPSNPSSPTNHPQPTADKEGKEVSPCEAGNAASSGVKDQAENSGNRSGPGAEDEMSPAVSPTSDGDLEPSEELTEEGSPCHNNNKDRDTKEQPRYRLRWGDGESSGPFGCNEDVKGERRVRQIKCKSGLQSSYTRCEKQ